MGVYLGSQSVNLKGGQPSTSPTPSGSEPKNVNFYDYEGTLLKSYTTDEWASVTGLPANPTHEGLVSQGWNWTAQQINSQLTAYPNQPVYVGQMYITDDGKTRLYVHFEKGRTSPYLGLGVNGTVEIDWGDGSATDTLTGTSTSTLVSIQHVYQPGDYVITLTPTSGSFSIFGDSSTSHILKKNTETTANISRVYTNALKKVELGSNVALGNYAFVYCSSLALVTIPSGVTSIGNYAFEYCYSLTSVTIPDGMTSVGTYAFYYCTSLSSITIPYGMTSVGTYAFRYCYSLSSITIPDSVTSIGSYVFNGCYSLSSITIPDGVTSIGTYAFNSCFSLSSITIPDGVTSIGTTTFNNCYGMREYHFLSTTPPSLANSSVFNGIPSDCIIYVPMESVEAYKTATNWSTYASYIQGE